MQVPEHARGHECIALSSGTEVRDIRFVGASPAYAASGLLGWLSFSVGPLRLEGVTLRRTATGRLALSFPARQDRLGIAHAIVRPLDDATRRAIEAQVFRALGFEEGAR